MQQKLIKGKEFLLREETYDEYVVNESCYNKCSFTEDDVWFDVGGNIGIFPVFYGEKVKKIISFEPDKDNCNLFKNHLKMNGVENCELVEKAVVADDSKEVSFFLNLKKNKGAHSMFVKRGMEEVRVPATNINDMLEKYSPNKIKMDIEGGEYDLIKAIKNWDNIQEFIFEYHIIILKDHSGKKLKEIYDILGKHFSHIEGKDFDKLGKNWVIIVHCKK